jgi:LacI family transcriptional regulator
MRARRLVTQPRASTVNDVAREARVSVASVSRVVNGHANVTPETRSRILDAVERLRYVPHTAARSLITKRTHVIGVLLPDLYGGFFSELIRGIDSAARELHLQLLLSCSHGNAEEMQVAIRAMRGRVEGLLVLAPQLDVGGLSELDPATPMVFMNSRVDGASSLAIDCYQGARDMVRHLVTCGHRSIAHIAGPQDNFDAHERERGYHDELAASLPQARPNVIRGDFSESAGYAAGRAIGAERRRPSAVFAANDGMALGCLAALDEFGLNVPVDIAVTGFDDIPLAAYVRPALTTMRVRIAELGRGAMNRLAEAIAHPEATHTVTALLRPDLVVRDSCGAVITRAPSPNRQTVSDGGHDETQARTPQPPSKRRAARARRQRRKPR